MNDSIRSPSYIPKLQVESRIKSKHRTPYTQGPIKPTKLYDGKMWCNRAQIQLQLCPGSTGIYTVPLLPKHSSPRLYYQSEVFRMNEKITVLASVLVRPEIGDIWILRGIVKETTQTGGDAQVTHCPFSNTDGVDMWKWCLISVWLLGTKVGLLIGSEREVYLGKSNKTDLI